MLVLAFLAQGTQGQTIDLINSLGLPIGFLVLVVGALRVLWKVMSQRDQQALEREIANTQRAEARADRLEAVVFAIQEDVRNRIMPTLERATLIMARELERKDRTP